MTRLGDVLIWLACRPVRAVAGLAAFLGTCWAVSQYAEGREPRVEQAVPLLLELNPPQRTFGSGMSITRTIGGWH